MKLHAHPRHQPFGIIVLGALILFAAPLPAEESPALSFYSEFDSAVSLKLGAEYSFSDEWGIRGSIGAIVIAPLQQSYAIVGVRHLRKPDSALQLDLEMGLIQAQIFNLFEPIADMNPYTDTVGAYWLPGVGVSVGIRTKRGHLFALRAGGGYRFGFDLGKFQQEAAWDLALEYGYKPLRR